MAKTKTAVKSKTSEATFRHANVSDAEEIQKLVNYYAKKQQMLARSLNDIYENIRDFMVIEKKGKIIATGALHICWSDLAEIRSVAVAPRYVKKGYGKMIVGEALEEAVTLNIPRIFVLTYQPGFFEKMGFNRIDMAELPKKIWADCIKCVHFPNCNEIAMRVEL
ncbi:MAG TPA: N-acetyltransferase [bacterium]|nr:N-acetyltransferase [bacterium]